jgi:hypothetical protein
MSLWRQCLGKLAKGFTDREVAVNLGPNYDMAAENSLEGTGCGLSFSMHMSVGAT